MWALSLKEETGQSGPFVLVTGAYTREELWALPAKRLLDHIHDLSASRRHHDANINGGDYPLRNYDGGANACERAHLAAYEYDIAVLRRARAHALERERREAVAR